MISLQSANIAAEEILDQAKKLLDAEKNSKAPTIHPRDKFTELEAFPAWQHAAIIKECGAAADRQWQVVFICLALMCIGLAAWFFFLPARYDTGPIALAFIFFTGLPFVSVRRIYMRNHLRKLVDLRRNSSNVSSGELT